MVTLEARPPFRLDLTVWALRRRAHNAVDRWEEGCYRRVLVIGGEPVEVAVTQRAQRVEVAIARRRAGAALRSQVAATLTKMLGLTIDLAPFYALAEGDAWLGALAERFRGLKPPRFPTLFEALLNAYACQQLSLEVGIHLLNRLAAHFGRASGAMPLPEDLAAAGEASLRALGFSGAKARALLVLAAQVAAGEVDLESIAPLDDAQAAAFLCALPGIGRWSAEYVLLRGLGRIHLFPGDDVGARKRLARLRGVPEPLDYEGVARVVAPWRPYAGLVYFHLLLHGLAERGLIDTE